MKIYIRTYSGETTPSIIRGKLMSRMRLDVQFLNECEQPEERAEDVELRLAAKTSFASTSYTLDSSSWEFHSDDCVYTFDLVIDNPELQALFTSVPQLDFIAEIEWTENSQTHKSETFTMRIQNAVIKS